MTSICRHNFGKTHISPIRKKYLISNNYSFSSFLLQAPSPPSLRFFAHKQIACSPTAYSPSLTGSGVHANEKFGVIFKNPHNITSIHWGDLVTAREGPPRKRSQLASEKQDGITLGFILELRGLTVVPMGGPLRRLCVLRGDTLVQYAACFFLAFSMERAG